MNTYILLASGVDQIVERHYFQGETFQEGLRNKLEEDPGYFGLEYINYIEEILFYDNGLEVKNLNDEDKHFYTQYYKDKYCALTQDQLDNYARYHIYYFKNDSSFAFYLLKIQQPVHIQEIDLHENISNCNLGRGGAFPAPGSQPEDSQEEKDYFNNKF